MAIENNDTFLMNDKSKDLMVKLRSAIIKDFKDAWIYLYKMESNYELYAANRWGGSLDDDEASELKLFVTDFMLDPANKYPDFLSNF